MGASFPNKTLKSLPPNSNIVGTWIISFVIERTKMKNIDWLLKEDITDDMYLSFLPKLDFPFIKLIVKSNGIVCYTSKIGSQITFFEGFPKKWDNYKVYLSETLILNLYDRSYSDVITLNGYDLYKVCS